LRFVTLNLWGARPPLARRLEVIAAGLRALVPDVVMLQEVRSDDELPNTAATLAGLLGKEWRHAFACGTRGPAGTFGAGSLPGEEGVAVLSRYAIGETRTTPLPEAREDETRVLLSVLVEAPGARVWAHTTHLHWRLIDGVAREKQVVAVDAAVRAVIAEEGAGESVLHVIGGDFNAAPDCDEIRFLTGRHTLEGKRAYWQDAFHVAHPEERGWTWARCNPMTESLAWLERDRRIDYVFVRPERRNGSGRVVDARVVLDVPGEDGTWPSDHFGVLADVMT
jgi:endonuclease/exonuclease/phosphatase family metal-dependent hydrolase